MNVRPITPEDHDWVAELIANAFGSVRIMSNDHLIEDASLLDGFAAEIDGRPVGCALLNDVDGDVESKRRIGTHGQGLKASAVQADRRRGARRRAVQRI